MVFFPLCMHSVVSWQPQSLHGAPFLEVPRNDLFPIACSNTRQAVCARGRYSPLVLAVAFAVALRPSLRPPSLPPSLYFSQQPALGPSLPLPYCFTPSEPTSVRQTAAAREGPARPDVPGRREGAAGQEPARVPDGAGGGPAARAVHGGGGAGPPAAAGRRLRAAVRRGGAGPGRPPATGPSVRAEVMRKPLDRGPPRAPCPPPRPPYRAVLRSEYRGQTGAECTKLVKCKVWNRVTHI